MGITLTLTSQVENTFKLRHAPLTHHQGDYHFVRINSKLLAVKVQKFNKFHNRSSKQLSIIHLISWSDQATLNICQY